MNCPLRITEVAAHLAIITIIDRATDEEWHWRSTHDAIRQHLEAFAPRCNCGYPLWFSPRLDGARLAKCERCGWKCLEAML